MDKRTKSTRKGPKRRELVGKVQVANHSNLSKPLEPLESKQSKSFERNNFKLLIWNPTVSHFSSWNARMALEKVSPGGVGSFQKLALIERCSSRTTSGAKISTGAIAPLLLNFRTTKKLAIDTVEFTGVAFKVTNELTEELIKFRNRRVFLKSRGLPMRSYPLDSLPDLLEWHRRNFGTRRRSWIERWRSARDKCLGHKLFKGKRLEILY